MYPSCVFVDPRRGYAGKRQIIFKRTLLHVPEPEEVIRVEIRLGIQKVKIGIAVKIDVFAVEFYLRAFVARLVAVGVELKHFGAERIK